MRFIILLHKVLSDYVTLFEVYECAINPELLEERIQEGQRRFERGDYVLVDPQVYVDHPELQGFAFHLDQQENRMKAALADELEVPAGAADRLRARERRRDRGNRRPG